VLTVQRIETTCESKKMLNLILNNQFIIETVGIATVEQHIRFRSALYFVGKYIMPFAGIVIFITNMVVSILSAIIYAKTKKKNHKPAFVFIGILSCYDMLVGG
jgi:tellurite resistance protein TehA-like permease